LSRHLAGEVTGLDQSAQMVAIAREQVPDGTFVQGDALSLPFEPADPTTSPRNGRNGP
jgi:ubiquinone/menaquinone biosynthesis C-methylase UbiE